MIMSLLGKVIDAEGLTTSDTYVGYCVDMASATHRLPGASEIWVCLYVNVAAVYTNSDEYYEFQLRTGTGTDGTDINAGALIEIKSDNFAGNDTRITTAGNAIMEFAISPRITQQRYWQIYYNQTGTAPAITIDGLFSFTRPRTNYNIQVEASPVGVP